MKEFTLSKLNKLSGAKSKKTRVGRGMGSGHGGHTSTRGLNGMKARTGGKVPWYFEGGQLPLFKRLPFLTGFNSKRLKNVIVKSSTINKLGVTEVTPKVLVKKGVLKKQTKANIKILFDEKLSDKITLKGLLYSKKVRAK